MANNMKVHVVCTRGVYGPTATVLPVVEDVCRHFKGRE
ncbi:hypothetical protein GMES_3356 [Paraglaciecola mesophila KMM 241]|uniref:Uncharacterized protein n=1 Tax=Paraglaciecola mesophila KMM 241 TaxID=1128912 RepID=K6XYG3_9ALTE|nr:hypothetical protein GMES_3356 [Paraglaciecola mesophila KMM 241]